jgi:tetratricopeptide (TPR) repeat protein
MKIKIYLAAAMTLICTGSEAHADNLTEGKNLYNKGEYNKAAEVFSRVIQKDSRNSTAHYYMANCYVAKHDWNEAKAEYRSAASLTNDEKVRDYCLTVVASLETSHPGASGVPHSGSSGPSAFDQAAARGQSVINQGQSETKFIMEQAERDCAQVNQDKNAALMPLQGFNIRSQTAVSTEDERNSVAAPYDKRMQEIRSRARARCDALMKDTQKRASDVMMQ